MAYNFDYKSYYPTGKYPGWTLPQYPAYPPPAPTPCPEPKPPAPIIPPTVVDNSDPFKSSPNVLYIKLSNASIEEALYAISNILA
jgi:hypothetical protein